MGVLESTCPQCGAKMTIVFHDRSLETLMIQRTCDCPSVVSPPALAD